MNRLPRFVRVFIAQRRLRAALLDHTYWQEEEARTRANVGIAQQRVEYREQQLREAMHAPKTVSLTRTAARRLSNPLDML